ncbi:MAG TPA: M56 family metallopeptidase, partial [Bacillota bacterium]|nr:M56 family metallopeptidase [Bacillota bacterium]
EYKADGSIVGYVSSDFPTVIAENKTTEEYARLEKLLAFRAIFIPIWLSGMAAFFVVFIVSNGRLAFRLRRTRKPVDRNGSVLPVYVTQAVETPCLFGLFFPAIYLTPEAAENAMILRHTVEHETTHFRHGDHFWSALRGVCLALHWYNPLVWWAAILSRNDSELACDEGTIRRIGEDGRAEYGRTLISMTCQKRSNLLGTATTMTGSKKSIKERITLIAKKPKMAIYTLIAVLLVAAIAVYCTFTGAKENAKPWIDNTMEIAVEVDDSIPEAVIEDAKEYVWQQIESYRSAWLEITPGCSITAAKISGLTQMNTGTASQNYSLNMYQLEYRLLAAGNIDSVLVGGMNYEEIDGENWLTEGSSMGQPYLLLYHGSEANDWLPICVTNTDVITQDYGTPEMLEKYGNAYTAATMVLYQNYLEADRIVFADYATEELLSQYDSYNEFDLRQDDDAQRIIVTTNTVVENFRFMDIRFSDTEGNELYFIETKELYALESFTPDIPLVVWVSFPGSIPQRAISFVDQTGATQVFAIGTSGLDNSVVLIEIQLRDN